MRSDYETLLVRRDGPVATIALNRPAHRNSIGGPMMAELHEVVSGLTTDPEVRVLVLRGEGADFCPGADVKHYGGGGTEAARRAGWTPIHEFQVPVMLHEAPAVTIAAISGACAGAGFGWACACDLRIASETARFNSAFLDVGVAGDMGGPWTLPRILGAAKARELYFLPGKFDAAELAANVSPRALAVIKAQLHRHLEVGFEAAAQDAAGLMAQALKHPDATEGAQSFLERRPPRFAPWTGDR